MGVKLVASSGGSVELVPTNTASNFTVTVPAVTASVLTDSSGVMNIGSGQVYKDASGNVGIGTTSPTSVAGYGGLTLGGSTGGLLTLRVGGTDTGYVLATSSEFAFKGTTAGPATFYTNNTERMRIDSSGKILIGKTATNDATVGVELQPNGYTTATTSSSVNTFTVWNVYSTGASAYRFYVGAGGTIYATSTTITGISDQRLKENIRDLNDGLATVMALKPRKFDWKTGKGKDIKNDRGFIAQEFETVLPDMVEEWLDPAPEGEEPYKAVNANLIPTLVKAIQEQQALITTLTERITALENK